MAARTLCRLPLLACASALLMPTALAAAGLPDGWTLDVEAQIEVTREGWETQGKKRRVTRRETFALDRKLRVFRVGEQVVVSRPDFTYPVKLDGRQITKDAVAATADTYRCVEFRSAGDPDEVCAQYHARPNGIDLKLRNESWSMVALFESSTQFRLTVSGESCRVELISYTSESKNVPVPVGRASGSSGVGKLASGSCRLLQGKRPF
ncbi:hypothetical protein [Ancylobacter sp. IITR112]|uniref:hypothetical protein n=1 Tax=Ancylobacter sp. IITR112 TaxID=3138073 RepID=UPI00352B022C